MFYHCYKKYCRRNTKAFTVNRVQCIFEFTQSHVLVSAINQANNAVNCRVLFGGLSTTSSIGTRNRRFLKKIVLLHKQRDIVL